MIGVGTPLKSSYKHLHYFAPYLRNFTPPSGRHLAHVGRKLSDVWPEASCLIWRVKMTCMFVCECVHVRVYVFLCTRACVCVCVYVCVFVCVYVIVSQFCLLVYYVAADWQLDVVILPSYITAGHLPPVKYIFLVIAPLIFSKITSYPMRDTPWLSQLSQLSPSGYIKSSV